MNFIEIAADIAQESRHVVTTTAAFRSDLNLQESLVHRLEKIAPP